VEKAENDVGQHWQATGIEHQHRALTSEPAPLLAVRWSSYQLPWQI